MAKMEHGSKNHLLTAVLNILRNKQKSKHTQLLGISEDVIIERMISRHVYQGITWIDLESPTESEMEEALGEYGLFPLIGEALLSPTRHGNVELFEKAIYLVLHFPIFHENNEDDRVEVDFVIGKNFLITVRNHAFTGASRLVRKFEDGSLFRAKGDVLHAGFLFFHMIRELYESLFEELEEIDDRLEDAEKKVFQGGEQKMVGVLSEINKDLLDFKQSTRSHERVLESLQTVGCRFFGNDFSYHLHSITNEFQKVWNALEAHKETLEELRQTNDALLSASTTRVMRTLTIITFATSPSIIIAGLFGMNTTHGPIIGHANDFWIVVLIILFLTTIIFGFFAYKKWL